MKHLVVGYHGTDASSAKSILDNGFDRSRVERPGWLGPGLYFWEQDEQKAWKWAERKKNRGTPKPVVLRAQLNLSAAVLDLTTTKWKSEYSSFLRGLGDTTLKRLAKGSEKVPVTDGAWLPVFMRAVMTTEGLEKWRAVRAVVLEGDGAYRKDTTRSLTALPKAPMAVPDGVYSRVVSKVSVVVSVLEPEAILRFEHLENHE